MTLAEDETNRNGGDLPEASRTLHVVGAAIVRAGRVLGARRAPHVAAPELWEFPGGKVEAGERPEDALRREIAEELGLSITVHERVGRGVDPHERRADGRTIVLDVYRCALETVGADDPAPRLVDHDQVRWLAASEIDPSAPGGLAWAAADVPILGAVRELLETRCR